MKQRPPADRTAVRRSAKIEPNLERQRIALAYAQLQPTQHFAAADIIASWPRLIHELARRGELAAPSFESTAA